MKISGAAAGLASTYDLYKKMQAGDDSFHEYITSIDEFSEIGDVFIDSGNYESFRYDVKDWWTEDRFLEIVSKLNKKYNYFTFDKYEWFSKVDTSITKISQSIEKLLSMGVGIENIIPVLHINGVVDLRSQGNLKKIVNAIFTTYKIKYISIPERDIGTGIFNRIRFINNFKRNVREINSDIKIHLLGTGNPLSMLLLRRFGVDTCDGLEWCRQSIDSESALLFHPQHYDFFKDNLVDADRKILEILKNDSFNYNLRIVLHNACFMKYWDSVLPNDNEHFRDIVRKTFPPQLVQKIEHAYIK